MRYYAEMTVEEAMKLEVEGNTIENIIVNKTLFIYSTSYTL